jgi:hypothetical protein
MKSNDPQIGQIRQIEKEAHAKALKKSNFLFFLCAFAPLRLCVSFLEICRICG